MAKLNVYQTPQGAFAAVNEGGATAQSAVLAVASTAENIAVTSGATLCRLQSDNDSWYEFDATAAVPVADVTTGSSVFLKAGQERYVICEDITNISVVSATAGAIFSALFWD